MDKAKLLHDRLKIAKKRTQSSLFHKEVLKRKIILPFRYINSNINDMLMYKINNNYEGKCLKEGFVRSGSSEIISSTIGNMDGSNVTFHVIFRCDVCYPYEDMIIDCMVDSITKIGIKAIVSKEDNPIVIFLSREHNTYVDIDKYEEA